PPGPPGLCGFLPTKLTCKPRTLTFATMLLVESEAERSNQPLNDLEVVGLPLNVLFADGEDMERLRAQGQGVLVLEPPFHLSHEDAYLVLPSDIGLEIVDIMRDADLDLLHETMRDSLVV